VVSIFTLSLTAAEALSKLNIFFWFGIGFGNPLLLLSFFSGAAQRWITRQFTIRARLINIVSGVLLLGWEVMTECELALASNLFELTFLSFDQFIDC
jgi:cytochrome c biogenesis protein CcdA